MDKNHIKVGKICGDKIEFEDGIGCCIWYPFKDDENSGCCWDFDFNDIDYLIKLLQQLKKRTPSKYEREPNDQS